MDDMERAERLMECASEQLRRRSKPEPPADWRELFWVDSHLDLASVALAGRDMLLPAERVAPLPYKGLNGRAAVTIPALEEANFTTVIGTIFTEPRITTPGDDYVDGPWCYDDPDGAHRHMLKQISTYAAWARAGLIDVVGIPATVPSADGHHMQVSKTISVGRGHGRPGRIQVLMAMEGADGLRTIDDLAMVHEFGVQMIGLAGRAGSQWAAGNRRPGDLTTMGRQIVARMDQLKLVHDVSHLAEQAFWSLLGASRGPIVASHSTCRDLLENRAGDERNLTDQQIKALTARGGMIGLNLFTRFLVTTRRATIADAVHHILHIMDIAGRGDCVGLGSDMDGMLTADDLPQGLDHPRNLVRLAEALSAAGASDDDVRGFAGANWRRFFGTHLGVSL